jgi:hypothetical protein
MTADSSGTQFVSEAFEQVITGSASQAIISLLGQEPKPVTVGKLLLQEGAMADACCGGQASGSHGIIGRIKGI